MCSAPQLSSYTPAFDLQQACGTGLQAAIAAADGIAAGRYEVAAAGGVDTTSDAPIALGDNLRRTLLEVAARQVQRATAEAGRHLARQPGHRDPGQQRAAHRAVDGRASGDHRQEDGHQARRPGRAGRRQPPQHGRRLRPRLFRRPGHAVLGAVPRRQPAGRLVGGEAGQAAPGLRRQGRRRDDDGGQLDSADRRRVGRAAGHRGVGGRALADPVGLLRRRRDRSGRLRQRRATAC